jgi:hypothetical protein
MMAAGEFGLLLTECRANDSAQPSVVCVALATFFGLVEKGAKSKLTQNHPERSIVRESFAYQQVFVRILTEAQLLMKYWQIACNHRRCFVSEIDQGTLFCNMIQASRVLNNA